MGSPMILTNCLVADGRADLPFFAATCQQVTPETYQCYYVKSTAGATSVSTDIPGSIVLGCRGGKGTFNPSTDYQCVKNNNAYECKSVSTSTPSTSGPTIAAAVMGVLFGLSLLTIGFLTCWGKKSKRKHTGGVTTYITPPVGKEDHTNHTALQSENAALNAQLAQANARVTTLQGALLSANASSGPLSKFMPYQPRDDKQIGKEFEQISQEIKDYAGNYFRSTGATSPDAIISQVSAELAESLVRVVPTWDRVLREEGTKGKAILVRAVVWSILQQAWEEGDILGKLGFEERTLYMALLETGSDGGEVQFWRRSTFAMLVNSHSFNVMRNEAIGTITTKIDQLVSPLASSPPSHERYQFLYGVVQKASNLALELALQVADYRVQVSQFMDRRLHQDEPAPSLYFEARIMDDVTQAYQTITGPDGLPRNVMEGKGIRGIVTPGVVKWGDHRGENWDGAAIVAKAKVLI